MVQRSAQSDFLPGVYVFPGGMLEPTDYAPRVDELCSGITPEQARHIISDIPQPEKALGLLVAAIREVFEEVRILLAYRNSNGLVPFNAEKERQFTEYRRQMQEGSLSFLEMIRSEGLTLATDQIFYFAHFITPPISPIRFDTRFFVAPAPPCQDPLHDALETSSSRWVTPEEALEGHKRQEFPMILPTIYNIEALAHFSSVDEAIASARNREVTFTSLELEPRVST